MRGSAAISRPRCSGATLSRCKMTCCTLARGGATVACCVLRASIRMSRGSVCMLRASICVVAWRRVSLRGGVVARLHRFYLADRQLHALGCANRRVFKIVMNVVVARARRVRPIRDKSCGTSRGPSRASCRIAAARHRDLSWGARNLAAPRLEFRSPVSAQHTPRHNTAHHNTEHNTAEAHAGTLCAQLIVQLLPVATAERLARTAFDSAHSVVTKLQRYAPVVPVVAATLLCLFASNSV